MSPRPLHHQRPLAACAAAYGVGVWAGVRFVWRPYTALAGLLLCLGAVFLLPRIGKKRVLGAMGAFLFAGMLLSGAAAHPPLPQEGKYRVTGVLASDPQPGSSGRLHAYLEHALLEADGVSFRLSRAYWTYDPGRAAGFSPREGDRVSFPGRLYHFRGQVNPYGFDERLYQLRHGAAAGVSGYGEAAVVGHPGRGLLSFAYQSRKMLDDRIRRVFGAGAALPEALLLGVRDELPRETSQAFSDVGIAHLLAISGLHVTLLAEALMLPLRRVLGRKTAFGVLAAFLLCYCALLDFAAPVVRASVLMLAAKGRRLVRRAGDGCTALAAAFLLILLVRPLDLFSASFQLSFCAVLGIVLIVPGMERKRGGGLFFRLRRGLAAPAAATVFVAVPTIQIFHRISLLGFLVNPAACALFAVLIPLYALILCVGCVSLPAGQALANAVNAAAGGLTAAVGALGKLPFSSVRAPVLPWYCVAAVAAALLLSTRYVLWPRRRKAAAALAGLAAAAALWPLQICRDVQYIQLAVGQADCALILDGKKTVMIDAGSYGGDAASYLLSTGRNADVLVLTHLHSDHCLGVRQLMEKRIDIGEVWLPEGAEEQKLAGDCLALLEEIKKAGVPVGHLAAGDTLRTERTALTAVWPEHGKVLPGQDANRYSLALLCDLDGVKLHSAGDLAGAYEHYAARDADLLKLGHHGSKNSAGDEFLDIVTPDAAIATGSGSATAALPNPRTAARLAARGIPCYDTGKCGAVSVAVRGGRARISLFCGQKETE